MCSCAEVSSQPLTLEVKVELADGQLPLLMLRGAVAQHANAEMVTCPLTPLRHITLMLPASAGE